MSAPRRLDELDARLLLALTDDPRATVLSLAEATGASRNTIHARLHRIDEGHILRPFDYRIDPAALGYPLSALVTIIATQRELERLANDLAALPEVLYVYGLSGGSDLLVRVVARDADDLYRLTGQINALPGVERSRTALTIRRLVDYRVAPLLRRSLRRES